MSATPAIPIPAASVVLLRDSPDGPELLLVRRHEKTSAFSGATVFPGGTVDPEDGDPATGPLPVEPTDLGEELDEPRARALLVATCRELHEEVGVLLARRGGGAAAAPTLGRSWAEEVAAGCRPDFAALVPHARWVTPAVRPRRWDTWFFLARAPAGQVAVADGRETTEALWRTPDALLAEYAEGGHLLIPPTFRILEALRGHADVATLLEAARSEGPPPPVHPVPHPTAETVTMLYQGDRDYPGSDATGFDRVEMHEGRWRSRRQG